MKEIFVQLFTEAGSLLAAGQYDDAKSKYEGVIKIVNAEREKHKKSGEPGNEMLFSTAAYFANQKLAALMRILNQPSEAKIYSNASNENRLKLADEIVKAAKDSEKNKTVLEAVGTFLDTMYLFGF